MELIYAKLWLKKYIKYNHANLDENRLNRAIINLSHRVYKSHGLHGHNTRQHIRQLLINYSKAELATYDIAFERPLRIQYRRRFRQLSPRKARGFTRFLWSLIKTLGFVVLLIIIFYILHIL